MVIKLQCKSVFIQLNVDVTLGKTVVFVYFRWCGTDFTKGDMVWHIQLVKPENSHTKFYIMINLHESYVVGLGLELTSPVSAIRLARD